MPYKNNYTYEGRICLFDPHANSIEQIAKFTQDYSPYKVATTQNKVTSYARYFE